MLQDFSGAALGGSTVVLAGIAWVAASYFISSPVIAARTIEKNNWHQQCRIRIAKTAQRQQRIAAPPPAALDCEQISGAMLGTFGQALCKQGLNQFLALAQAKKKAAYEAVQRQRQQAVAVAVGNSGTRCNCAVSAAIESNQTAWAIYAGSFRLITPIAVAHQNASLVAALNSPKCSKGLE